MRTGKELAEGVLTAFKAHLTKRIGDVLEYVDSKAAQTVEWTTNYVNEAIKQHPSPKDGVDGKDGAPGRDGIDGKDGAAGERGADGAPGRDGIDGKDGERGADGERGFPGENGERGADGINGKDGADGVAGKDGADGRDGRDGTDGRDALAIEIVDMDEQRSYARGTYVTYRGGLLRALRTTDRIAGSDEPLEKLGWQIILNGIQHVMVQQQNERTFVASAVTTDGKSIDNVFKIPVMLQKGVWRHGKYERGDVTTRDGSMWHAEKDTETEPSTQNSDWKLVVKHGKDGKDGKDGKPGPQGERGPAGRDLTQMGHDGRKW